LQPQEGGHARRPTPQLKFLPDHRIEIAMLLTATLCSSVESLLLLVPLLLVVAALLPSKAPPISHSPPRSLGAAWRNSVDIYRNADRMHDWTAEHCRRLGGAPFVLRSLGNPDQLVVYTPALVEDVLKTHFASFPKGEYVADVVRDLVGEGIFAADGAKWAHQRKTVSALLSKRALRDSMTAVIQQRAESLYAVLAVRTGVTDAPLVDLSKLLSRFTMETFAEIGFGIRMDCLHADMEHPFQAAFDRAQRAIASRFLRPRWAWKLSRWLQIGRERQLRSDLDVINSTVVGIIQRACEQRQRHHHRCSIDEEDEKSETTRSTTDIVSLFLDGMKEDQEVVVDPMYLRDIVVTFIMAGRDSIAQATSWFFHCLSMNPGVEARIRDEMTANGIGLIQLGADSGDDSSMLSMDQMHELVYLEAALKETLRLFPSVPFFRRRAERDVVLSDGTFVRANSTVALATYAMARMPFVWGEDAAQFKPERWLEPETGRLRCVSPFKFSAFNAGPRTCVGKNLAMLEMKLLVVGLLRRFHIAVDQPEHVTYDCSMSLAIKGPLLARVSPTCQAGARRL
jgi:cytochrome P450